MQHLLTSIFDDGVKDLIMGLEALLTGRNPTAKKILKIGILRNL